ncbi:hypothetical protein PCL_07077 [Purpureocillium lilacinum]|uniref:Uncharacterized protein n=1 Tax=Purpureocillium lilacinum TaxID=33203 RepID=A0A2U3DTA0_PURLI|nr:hypothetical protein PCL_07077 [Purpureocillium lilacinum]
MLIVFKGILSSSILTEPYVLCWYIADPPAFDMIGFNSPENDLPYVHTNSPEGPYVVLPLTFRDSGISNGGPSITKASWINASSVSLSREVEGLIRGWNDQVCQDRSNTVWADVVCEILSRYQVVISVEEFTMDAESLKVRNAIICTYNECVSENCAILRNAWAQMALL